MNHGLPHGFWKQHKLWTSAWSLVAAWIRALTWFLSRAQTTDLNMASHGSTDYRTPSRRLSADNEPLYIYSVVLPLTVRAITGLVSVSEGGTRAGSRLLHTTLPSALAALLVPWAQPLCLQPEGSTSAHALLLSEGQTVKRQQQQQRWLHVVGRASGTQVKCPDSAQTSPTQQRLTPLSISTVVPYPPPPPLPPP